MKQRDLTGEPAVFFDFLVGKVLGDVALVSVKTRDGVWQLDETVLFEVDGQWIQLFVDLDGQRWQVVSKNAVVVPGDYDDLISHQLESCDVVTTPSLVLSATEFATVDGKVIACEVDTADGGFALTLDPEDCIVLPSGEGRRYCEQVAVLQCGPLAVRSRTAAQQTVEADGG